MFQLGNKLNSFGKAISRYPYSGD